MATLNWEREKKKKKKKKENFNCFRRGKSESTGVVGSGSASVLLSEPIRGCIRAAVAECRRYYLSRKSSERQQHIPEEYE